MIKPQTAVARIDAEDKGRFKRRQLSNSVFAYFLLLPTLILIGVIIVYPLGNAVWLSLTNRTFINPTPTFVGLENYLDILRSDTFRQILFNSLLWTLSVVALQFIVGFATALLLNQQFRGRSLARALIIIPWVTPGVIAALLWRLLYEPQLGIINGTLANLGVPNPTIPWLSQSSTAMLAVIIAAMWKGTPFSTVMFLAGLQNVSQELLDASKVDGANFWSRLRHVVVPEMMPVFRTTVLLTTIFTFNYFDLIYIMTGGGPLRDTQIFPTWIYELAFAQTQSGLAAAYGILSTIILLIFSAFYIRELNKQEALG